MTFLDSNVLVYATSTQSPWHQLAQAAMDQLADAGEELWISGPILREYAAVLTRPGALAQPLTGAQTALRIEALSARLLFCDDTPRVAAHLIGLLRAISIGGAQVHDANIVATVLAHGIPRLLTANVQDFVRFGHLSEVVPLAD